MKKLYEVAKNKRKQQALEMRQKLKQTLPINRQTKPSVIPIPAANAQANNEVKVTLEQILNLPLDIESSFDTKLPPQEFSRISQINDIHANIQDNNKKETLKQIAQDRYQISRADKIKQEIQKMKARREKIVTVDVSTKTLLKFEAFWDHFEEETRDKNNKMKQSIKESMLAAGVSKLRSSFNKIVARMLLKQAKQTVTLMEFCNKGHLKQMKLVFDFWGSYTDQKLMEAQKMNKLYTRIASHNSQRQRIAKLFQQWP